MKALFLISIMLLAFNAQSATSLKDYSPYKYEVLFTNPVCKTYAYDQPLYSNDGEEVLTKKKNAYCKSSDSNRSAKRENTPHTRLIDWIKDRKTKEIFMAYLSFSKSSIAKEICNAIKYRNVKVTLIIDKKNESDEGRMATANMIGRCRPKNIATGQTANYPVVVTGGHAGRGRDKIGYAHNKVFFVNPNSKGAVKIAFSSANMSSGTVTHHENWHFVTTSGKSYFAGVHRCLRDGVLKNGSSITKYKNYISSCRSKIEAEEESDIKVYFVPGEGKKALETIKRNFRKSKSIQMAAHRFSYGEIINAASAALKRGAKVSLIADDDMYWTGVYGRGMGRNMLGEQRKVRGLEKQGMKTKYIETYADDVFEPKSLQLHHNKFFIFNYKNNSGAVFTGAGNMTSTAYNSNWENFYFITIPEVYEAFQKQYGRFWNDLGRSWSEMPTELVLP